MFTNVVRYRRPYEIRWGVVEDARVTPVEGQYAATRDFMQEGAARARRGGRQAGNERRLKPGDVIEASIRTDDGSIDLGVQRSKVV